MRLLYLTPRLPYPPNRGGEIIIFHFLEQLSSRHDITLVSFYDRPEDLEHRKHLEPYCSRIEAVPRPAKLAPRALLRSLAGGWSYSIARHTSESFRAAVRRATAASRPDLVQLETFLMAPYLAELPGVPSVLHMHDMTWVMWERMARIAPFYVRPLVAAEARRIRRDELALCRTVDMCVPVSEVDLSHLRAAIPGVRAAVVVPGVDCDALTPGERPASSSNLVFVGSMNYMPNIDAAQFFVKDVLPRISREISDVTFTIVGARPSPAVRRLGDDPRVRVTGPVDDVRPYYAAAAAAVVPLRAAGGVRMKILEGMALGVPIVSTTIGAEGLGLEDGCELLIGDTPQQLADAAIRLVRDSALRERLSRQARATALRRFSWESVGRRLEEIYASVLAAEVRR